MGALVSPPPLSMYTFWHNGYRAWKPHLTERRCSEDAFVSTYRQMQLVAKGSASSVYRGVDRRSGRPVAIKTIVGAQHRASALREASILAACGDDCVCDFVETICADEETRIITEFLEGGDLFGRVFRENGFSEARAKIVLRQVASALDSLHAKGVAHLDVKPENICCHQCDQVKLVDFGSARFFLSPVPAMSATTPDYAAPEIILASASLLPPPASPAIDVYALGLLTFFVLTAEHPSKVRRRRDIGFYRPVVVAFEDDDDKDDELTIRQRKRADEILWPRTLSPQARDFCNLCLQRDPKARPSVSKLLDHPFLSSNNS